MKRRKFIKASSLSGAALLVASTANACQNKPETVVKDELDSKPTYPLVIATWNAERAVSTASEVLTKGGTALDAVEEGCKIEEGDPKNITVGLGGLPDRDGNVTLDSCVMDNNGNCGSVVYLQNIVHAVSVARKVMEETPHVMLAGSGAEQFAYEMGFEKTNLLTAESQAAWEKWKVDSKYQPIINIENHDTIGMIAIDKNGQLSGACTTSGLSYKMGGRVGDSPIIGSGLFIDNEIGGAVATGLGEEVVKTVGSFLIVELMRQGKTPQQACEEAIKRIVEKPGSQYRDFQVGYIATNKKGEVGYYSIHPDFSMTIYRDGKVENLKSTSYINS